MYRAFGALFCVHFDFNYAGGHSYEQTFEVIRRLGLGMDTIEEQFRRMVFYVVAGNQDDHVKNTAFLMNKQGQRSLSPADDVTYANENMDGEKVLEATGAELMSYSLSGSDSGEPLPTHQGSCWHYLLKQI